MSMRLGGGLWESLRALRKKEERQLQRNTCGHIRLERCPFISSQVPRLISRFPYTMAQGLPATHIASH